MSSATAKTIRTNLKAAGYKTGGKNAQVSVRSHSYSMGSSVTVRVIDPAADFDQIEAIAEGQQSVRRCEMTGDILSGGNTFVRVIWDQDATDAFQARWIDAVRDAWARIEDNVLEPIAGSDLLLGRDSAGDATIWSEGGNEARVWTGGGENLLPTAERVGMIQARLGRTEKPEQEEPNTQAQLVAWLEEN